MLDELLKRLSLDLTTLANKLRDVFQFLDEIKVVDHVLPTATAYASAAVTPWVRFGSAWTASVASSGAELIYPLGFLPPGANITLVKITYATSAAYDSGDAVFRTRSISSTAVQTDSADVSIPNSAITTVSIPVQVVVTPSGDDKQLVFRIPALLTVGETISIARVSVSYSYRKSWKP